MVKQRTRSRGFEAAAALVLASAWLAVTGCSGNADDDAGTRTGGTGGAPGVPGTGDCTSCHGGAGGVTARGGPGPAASALRLAAGRKVLRAQTVGL